MKAGISRDRACRRSALPRICLCFAFVCCVASLTAQAQVVQAHYAQHLVTATMSAHPELQKLGIHVVPPGQADDLIVACSVPSKIGKKSSPADLEVEHSAKPSVKTVTERSFYDLALPLQDASGKNIGLLVMEMRMSGAASADESLTKAAAIRDELARQIEGVPSLFQPAPKSDPLVLLSTTKLPDIVGDFDHFAVDQRAGRLYVSAEVHHSIEVFNLQTAEHLMSAPGVVTPHTLAFDKRSGTLLVADGGDNSCRVLDAQTLQQKKRISLDAYPDAGYYDEESNRFYVGNGGKHGNEDYSFVSAISPDQGKVLNQVRVESNNLEAMALDRKANLLYVNMRDKAQIAVVDLTENKVRQTWTVPGLKLNTPMALDEAHHRLFVAGRQPGKLFIVDAGNGQVITVLSTVEKADDMTFDPDSARIFVTGAGGVTVVHQDDPDHYTKLTEFQTNEGKTSVLVPSLHRFYIIHTKTALDGAGLEMYQVN